MDFSKLNRFEVGGAVASAVLIFSVLALTWYDLSAIPERDMWICGEGNFTCNGWQTFPILRWLLLLLAAAPFILAWIVIRGHELAWPPGEMTMVGGFTGWVMIGYNGLIEKPGSGPEQAGISLEIGYYVALLAAFAIAVAGLLRSWEFRAHETRKAPGTI